MTKQSITIRSILLDQWRLPSTVVLLVVTLFCALPAFSQAPFPPPNQIQVYNIRGIDFGTFYPSAAGGSVTVDPSGTRSSSGVTLVGVGMGEAAIFDVVLIQGRLVSISFGPDVILTGNNGGSMILQVGPSDRDNSFVTTAGHPFRNQVNVGGTLQVGNLSANPPGNYNGSFTVTFHQN